MSNISTSKKKEQSLSDTFFRLCKDLLRFIDRKIIKSYISPNMAQIPKEMRNPEILLDYKNKVWTYFFKDKELTSEEKVKDIFKDDNFLGHVQILTNSLMTVVNLMEQNKNNINKLKENILKKEEKINTLNELKNMLNNYFEHNSEKKNDIEQEKSKNILEDASLMNIMNKIQSFKSNQNLADISIKQNIINLNQMNKNNTGNKNNNSDIKNNKNSPKANNSTNNININSPNNSKINQQYTENNDIPINKNDNNPKDSEKKEIETLYNQCLSAPFPSDVNDEISRNEPNSIDKNEINFFIDNFKINDSILLQNPLKESKKKDSKKEESLKTIKINNLTEEEKDYIFLNKKKEREKEKDSIDKENEIIIDYNDSDNNNKKSPEKKKKKNKKKKKSNKKAAISDNDYNIIENSIQIPLTEDISNLPEVKILLNNKKNEKKKDENLYELLIEKGNNKKNNNIVEDLFNSEIIKEFPKLSPKNNRIKIINDILSSIKNSNKNYNPKIKGPYLVGSYRAIFDLPSINYIAPIDIMYTYRDDMQMDKKAINNIINNIINNAFNLNIIETSSISEDNKKISKLRIKSTSKINKSIIIFFNIFFVDIGYENNDKIFSYIMFDREKIKFENKDDERKFINIILFFRIWRKKNKLLFIIPEILDEITKRFFESSKSMASIIFNVFYKLYNGSIDIKNKQGILQKDKSLIENLVNAWFDNENKVNDIKKAIIDTIKLINNNKFCEIFNYIDNEKELLL